MLLLVLLLLLCSSHRAAATNCTKEEQQAALVDVYSAWGGPHWRRQGGWPNTSIECEDSGVQMPAHCCWHGIRCYLSSVCADGDRTDINRCGSEPGLVWEIDLDSNNLVGNFSSLNHDAFACALYGMRISSNKLTGAVDEDFTLYEKLGYAQLQSNNLQGTLPKGIGKIFSLWLFDISKNSFEGSVPPDICGPNTRLFALSIEDNAFSGDLNLAHCKSLTYFEGKGNNFSTVFTEGISALPALRGVYLEENRLAGVIPPPIFINFLPHLEELGLYKNKLSGTLPVMELYSMKYISFSDNRLIGPVPESWSRAARPGLLVALETNYLSCCGTDPLPVEELIFERGIIRIDEVYQSVDYGAPRLPSFLELSDELEPVRVYPRQSFKAGGLRCPKLLLKGEETDLDPAPGDPEGSLQWFLDPSYYLFEKCECEEGLQLVNLTKPGRHPYLECQAPEASNGSKSWEEAYPWAIAIIVIVGCIILTAMMFGLYLWKGTEVVQKLNNLKKRMHGLPTSGPFTAVVTDIQGWTDLCSQYPDLSWKVLSIHNSTLRKARWNNFGSTHETEGDSFTMVFYSAKDAVAFCLQAQQMLRLQQWPSPKEANKPKRANDDEQSAPLMLPHPKPSNDSASKKSRINNSFSLLHPLSSSKQLMKRHSAYSGTPGSISIRVRMGLATGFLSPGGALHGHPTIELAKEVSNAAEGGQILMEGGTFTAVKDSLGELGTVDSQGMHLDRLRMRRVFSWPACFLCRFIAPKAAANSEDAVALDMGTYMRSRPEQEQRQSQTPPCTSSNNMRSSRSFLRNSMLSLQGTRLAGPSQKTGSPDDLHLYQVLSAADAEHAKIWGSNLRLGKEMPLKDSLSKGYFDAPGALSAPLGMCKRRADVALPLVTTVFAAVEHARILHTRDARLVERNLLACAQICLDQVPGDGYLCRSFGNLKLMLCFSKPEAALAWSCAMQECMIARPWPRAALKEPFKEIRDQHGNLIFRGPRLKVGISEGRPDSIQPDHLGRADYHGDCVNSAARFMEGAAQGGMIVCERQLAIKAAGAWAAMQSSSQTEQATGKPLQPSRSWSPSQSAPSFHGLLQHQPSEDGQPWKCSSPLLQENSSPLPTSAALTSPRDEAVWTSPGDEAALFPPKKEATPTTTHNVAALLLPRKEPAPNSPRNEAALSPPHHEATLSSTRNEAAQSLSPRDEAALSSPRDEATQTSSPNALSSPREEAVQTSPRNESALSSPRALADPSSLQDEAEEPVNSGESNCRESYKYLLQPPLPPSAHTPKTSQRDPSSFGNLQNLGHIHVHWLGLFKFKGITHARAMVHVLQDKLASRAAKFAPKSLNPVVASLASPKQQAKGPSKSTYLVPLPVVGDVDLALDLQEQGARITSVRFEMEGSQQDSGSRFTGRLSESSGRRETGTLSAPSQEPCQCLHS